MIFPITSLLTDHRELGLVLAVLVGFGFGFVLERAGFGRASKLTAQFFLFDMTVFKVMFGAIVTAMLGLVALGEVGLADVQAISESAVSATFLWPMLIGGLALGMGFVVSGYCPGTSVVAMASGNLDGLVTVIGVVVGSVLYSEAQPQLVAFHNSGDLGAFYLYQWLGVPAPVVALGVAVMAIGCFIGAEKVERIFSARRHAAALTVEDEPAPAPRFAFTALAAVAVLTVATLAWPEPTRAAQRPVPTSIGQQEFAEQLLRTPWTLRLLDVGNPERCAEQRIPGAVCVAPGDLGKLGLAGAPADRDLVIVCENGLDEVPAAVGAYRGRVRVLDGGYSGWIRYALVPPEVPEPTASPVERRRYTFRAGLSAAMTGMKAAPPPPTPTGGFAAPKKKGGGCS